MKQGAIQEFSKITSQIDGWLSAHDQAVFNVLLSYQRDATLAGDLLEIGVFAGKSAVLIGQFIQPGEEFHACDIFDEPTDERNADEISRSYQGLSRKIFENNCMDVLGYMPVIHQCLSTDLPVRLKEKTFRFIHVDGSHLYEHVSCDLDFSSQLLNQDLGIIAVDDFRAQHTVGVAVAVWELVLANRLVPIILTPAKIYLGSSNSNFDVQKIKLMIENLGIECVDEEILGLRVIRTTGLSDGELYSRSNWLKSFIPPIALDLLRKSYLLKKLRRR